MNIEITTGIFNSLMTEVSRCPKEEAIMYIEEIILAKEDYSIKVPFVVKDPSEFSLDSQARKMANDMNLKDSIDLSQKYTLKRTEDGILFKISLLKSPNDPIFEITITGSDIVFDDKGMGEVSKRHNFNIDDNAMKASATNSLYAVAKVIYNINNRITIQKEKIESSIKIKKIKNKNTRKKELKKIIVNKPVVVYTGESLPEPKEICDDIRITNFNVEAWESRGYWKTMKKSGKRIWTKGSVKRRQGIEQTDSVKVKKQEYAYK